MEGSHFFSQESQVINLIQKLTEPVILISRDEKIIWVNSAVESLAQYSVKELEGKGLESLFPDHKKIVSLESLYMRCIPEDVEDKYGEVITLKNREGSCLNLIATTTNLKYRGQSSFALILQDASIRKQIESPIYKPTYYDPVTLLPSRELLMDRLNQALAHSHRHQELVALMLIDLDDFKIINEYCGHLTGDSLLKSVSERLNSLIRNDDTLGRTGGDEFIVIFPQVDREEGAAKLARKLLDCFKKPFIVLNRKFYITPSIGISLSPNDGDTSSVLVKNAETAMYQAKKNGKNNYHFFDPKIRERTRSIYELSLKMRKAVEHEEFEVFYQPQVDFSSGKITGMEALVRWHTPSGDIPPGQFIPVAEETGLILELGKWVLKSACRQRSVWMKMGFENIRVAVNVSAFQFRQPNIVQEILDILKSEGLTGQHIELELTESVFLENPKKAFSVIKELQDFGITISIDDFGTGFSSLSYIKNINPGVVKIDREFSREVHEKTSKAIIKAIVAMAQSLNIETVAEGVETRFQFETLRTLGCNKLQGFLFSPPVSSKKATRLLEANIKYGEP